MSEALRVESVRVSFGRVVVLDGMDMVVREGEIHGLIGPNGAGKTTLVNALTSLVPTSAGRILLEREPLPDRPDRVADAGIARTFQAPSLCPELTARENVMLAASSRMKTGFIAASLGLPKARREEAALRARAEELMDRFGVGPDRDVPVAGLPFGDIRKIELARALMHDPSVLILDEPTAGLTIEEVGRVADLLVELRDEANLTVLLIEHNVPFVFGVCDQVTALDNGHAISTGTPDKVRNDPVVISSYLGASDVSRVPARQARGAASEQVVAASDVGRAELVIEGLVSGYEGTEVLHGVDLEVSNGEFVAIFGANGAGKSTLLNSIFGLPRPSGGRVIWNGTDLAGKRPEEIVRAGLGLVSQDGNFFAAQSVEDNLRLSVAGLGISRSEVNKRCDELFELFPRLARRRDSLAAMLSGGERRMLSIAKALIRRPRLLVLDEPSIGLAPQAVAELQGVVAGLEELGLPVLLAEQNAGWVMPLATRMKVLELGRLSDLAAEEIEAGADFLIDRYLGSTSAG